MTSCERRKEIRYQRRKQKRYQKQRKQIEPYDNYENIISFSSLLKAERKTRKGCNWKTSVQSFQYNLLKNINILYKDLQKRKDISKGFVEFDIMERGKIRHIRSVHYSERIVQRSLCDNCLVPIITNKSVFESSACLPGRGVTRAIDLMKENLRSYYRRYNTNKGYVVSFDFSDYFNSIPHKYIFDFINEIIEDNDLNNLIRRCVIPFGYPSINTGSTRIKVTTKLGNYTGKSLGLGSQVSQLLAVIHPNYLDHYIKQELRCKEYGRYMDDGTMIFRTKDEAKDAMNKIITKAEEKGIVVNKKKTKISRLEDGFVFLKTKFNLNCFGKVIIKLAKKNIVRITRKLKKFHNFVVTKIMDVIEVIRSYASWKGYALIRGAKELVEKVDMLFVHLFNISPPYCRLEGV